jgi:hypothetical protein
MELVIPESSQDQGTKQFNKQAAYSVIASCYCMLKTLSLIPMHNIRSPNKYVRTCAVACQFIGEVHFLIHSMIT